MFASTDGNTSKVSDASDQPASHSIHDLTASSPMLGVYALLDKFGRIG
jgi:hypothetical protein